MNFDRYSLGVNMNSFSSCSLTVAQLSLSANVTLFMTVLALCVIRGNSNFTLYRLSTSKLRNAFSTVSKYNGTSIISFGILGKTCFIASPIFFILAINESFSACINLSISRSSFLRLSAASRLCLSSLNCSCANSIFLFSIAKSSCLFASSLFCFSSISFASLKHASSSLKRIPYSAFPLFLLLLLSALLLLLSVLLLLFFSRHFLRLLSPSPELQPLLAPLLFSEPLFFSCALLSFSCLRASSCAFAISIYLRSETSLSF